MSAQQRSRRSSSRRSRAAPARVGLADALFTATQQKVLRLLYGQPGRSFFASELIALASAGTGAVQRELRRLEESGLVTSHTVGRQRHYQANADAPIFAELRRIVVKTFGIAQPLRQALKPLAARLTLACIYGSIARGSDSAASDIDLLVVSDELMLEDLYRALERAERLLGRKVNPTLVKTAEFTARRQSEGTFMNKIMSGPVIPLFDESNLCAAA
jgi:predicted nucleotidyltransferase